MQTGQLTLDGSAEEEQAGKAKDSHVRVCSPPWLEQRHRDAAAQAKPAESLGELVCSADNTTQIIPLSCQPSPFSNTNSALLKAPVMARTSEHVGSVNSWRLPTKRRGTGGLLASPDRRGGGGTATVCRNKLGADLLTACCGLTTIKLVASQ